MSGPDFNTEANLHADTVAERFDAKREDIETEHVYPPIPDRSMDWAAYLKGYDGAPDAKGPYSRMGHGPTEEAAIADLLEQIGDFS